MHVAPQRTCSRIAVDGDNLYLKEMTDKFHIKEKYTKGGAEIACGMGTDAGGPILSDDDVRVFT